MPLIGTNVFKGLAAGKHQSDLDSEKSQAALHREPSPETNAPIIIADDDASPPVSPIVVEKDPVPGASVSSVGVQQRWRLF